MTDNEQPAERAAARADGCRELSRLEILSGMRVSIWEAAFATVHAALTTGAFLTGFALWLGANDLAMGLLTAIPTFAGLIQIVASYFSGRIGPRRPFVAWFALVGRSLWLPILIVPLLLRNGWALPVFVLLYALSFVLLNVTAPAWTSWMSDLVPADHRGRYFARRNTIAGIVGMVISLPAAWFLDITTHRHPAPGLGFGILFGVAVIGGIGSFLSLMRQPEPPYHVDTKAAGEGGVIAFYSAPFADRNFRRLIAFNTVFGAGQFLAAPFFTVYAIKELHMNYIWLQLLATLASIGGLGSMALWGYLADKFGNKPLLAIGVVGVFFLPFIWIFTTARNPGLALVLLTINNLAGGLFWSGVGLTQFNLLIRLSPSEKTGVYAATMAGITGLTGGLAPMIGGAIMHSLEGWHATLFGMPVNNYYVTFALSGSLRLFALLFLKGITDKNASSARQVLQQLTEANPRAWREIRRLRGAADEETRLRATVALAESRTRLAVTELISALKDPSLAVREEAARALGEIGDPQAVEYLSEALLDPSTGLNREAAIALGRIGDRRATRALCGVLSGDREMYTPEDRIAAIRALGAVGGTDGAIALLALLQSDAGANGVTDDERETIARALGLIGDTIAAGPLAELLQRHDTPRPLRLALVRALGELGCAEAIPALREELKAAEADGVLFPLLADSLARLRDTEAIEALLDGLARQGSEVARKQAAHAVGVLIGQGNTLYSLLAQEAFARDAAVARLFEEIQKEVRPYERGRRVQDALDAFVREDYAVCVSILDALAEAYLTTNSAKGDPERLNSARALRHIAQMPEAGLPIEAVLVALFALRSIVRLH